MAAKMLFCKQNFKIKTCIVPAVHQIGLTKVFRHAERPSRWFCFAVARRLILAAFCSIGGSATAEEQLAVGECVEMSEATFCHEMSLSRISRGNVKPAAGSDNPPRTTLMVVFMSTRSCTVTDKTITLNIMVIISGGITKELNDDYPTLLADIAAETDDLEPYSDKVDVSVTASENRGVQVSEITIGDALGFHDFPFYPKNLHRGYVSVASSPAACKKYGMNENG